MPVSKISVFGSSWSNAGGQDGGSANVSTEAAAISADERPCSSTGRTEHVEEYGP